VPRTREEYVSLFENLMQANLNPRTSALQDEELASVLFETILPMLKTISNTIIPELTQGLPPSIGQQMLALGPMELAFELGVLYGRHESAEMSSDHGL
jgi:hypothetical protein